MRFSSMLLIIGAVCLGATAQIEIQSSSDVPGVIASGLIRAQNDRLSITGSVGTILSSGDTAYAASLVSVGSVPNNYKLKSGGIVLSSGNSADYGTGPNTIGGSGQSDGMTTEFGVVGLPTGDDPAAIFSAMATILDNDLDASDVTDATYLSTIVLSCSNQPIVLEVVLGTEEYPDGISNIVEPDGFGLFVNRVQHFVSDFDLDDGPPSFFQEISETELDAVQVTSELSGNPLFRLYLPSSLAVPVSGQWAWRLEFLIFDTTMNSTSTDFALDTTAYISQVRSVADVNRDGQVTPADFTAWVGAFNSGDLDADQNGDGQVTPADFNAWVSNFNASCP